MSEVFEGLLMAEQTAEFPGLKLATICRLTHTRELMVVRPIGKGCALNRLRDVADLLRVSSQSVRLARSGR